ncbi:MAG: AAA family ATPase [candidate division WOR-3 bacterium]
MFIKELQLIGFKSFMERTTLQFSPGLNAIVGPNGCGKSNILDALRWVLGEQAFSVLRCARNEDLIFSGTATVPALNYAEVKLVLATDGLPDLGSEVEIRRRFYRSGESEYYLNRQPCRLRDITEVFLAAGIGTKAYSIFDLRQMREIIAGNIRRLFEEAANLAKFREAKSECQSKLELTGTDLTRLEDIIAERERVVAQLKRQAGRLRAYQRLKEEEKKLTLLELRAQFLAAREELKRAQADLAALEQAAQARRAEIHRLEEELRQQHSRLRQEQERKEVLRAEVQRRQTALAELEARRLLDWQRLDFLTRRIGDAATERSRLTQSAAQLQEVFDRTVARLGELNERLSQMERRLQEAQEVTRTADARLFELKSHESTLREQLAGLAEEEQMLRAALVRAEAEVHRFQELEQRLEPELAGLELRRRTAEGCRPVEGSCPLAPELSRDEQRLKAELERVRAEKERATDAEARARTGLSECEARREGMLNGLRRCEEEIARQEKVVKGLLANSSQLLSEKAELRQQVSRLETEKGFTKQQLDDARRRISELEALMAAAEKEAQALREEIEGYEQEKAAAQAELERAEAAAQQGLGLDAQTEETLQANLAELRRAQEQHQALLMEQQIRCHELERQVQTICTDAQSDYGIDIANFQEEMPEDFTERLAQVRQRLAALGQVNPLAEDEFREEKQDLERLLQQRQDVIQAKANLEMTMHEIESHAQEQFRSTYELVRSHFQEVFRQLFLEGEADLVLINDQNPLESEIAIIARPKGKNPRRLEQLSDGEKALLAVSLLFAFYQVKPAPFCFLDEVDAPLDDANVGRFADYLKALAQKTQVIIITHNRATVERADVLFGVTAEEPGISKLVSVNLANHTRLKRAAESED